MIQWGKVIRRLTRFFFNPCPSLFDWCAVLGVIGMGFIPYDLKGFYLIFYSIFIICIGFNYPVLKKMKAGSLTLITLCALSSLFIHSFVLFRGSVTFQYLNVMLMMEGFAYIFFGSFLLYTLATKGRNLRLFIVTLPIALLWSIKYALHGGQLSAIVALVVGFSVWLVFKRRYLLLGGLVCASLALIIISPLRFGGNNLNTIDWLLLKFKARPACWIQLCKDIWIHPFVGQGFNKFIGTDDRYIIIWNSTKTVVMNCMYRQNDYLNIALLYGLPILLGIGLFLKDSFLRLKNSWMIAPFIAICLLAFVQMTFMIPDRALALVCVIGLFYSEN